MIEERNFKEPTDKNEDDSDLMPGVIEMNFIPATDGLANQDDNDEAQEDDGMIEQTGITIEFSVLLLLLSLPWFALTRTRRMRRKPSLTTTPR